MLVNLLIVLDNADDESDLVRLSLLLLAATVCEAFHTCFSGFHIATKLSSTTCPNSILSLLVQMPNRFNQVKFKTLDTPKKKTYQVVSSNTPWWLANFLSVFCRQWPKCNCIWSLDVICCRHYSCAVSVGSQSASPVVLLSYTSSLGQQRKYKHN